jgi:hypothetical protein
MTSGKLCLLQDMLTLVNINSNYHSQADCAIFLYKIECLKEVRGVFIENA